MSTNDHSRDIASLIKKLRTEFGPPCPPHVPLAPATTAPVQTAAPPGPGLDGIAETPASAGSRADASAKSAGGALNLPRCVLDPGQPILNEFVRSMLIWEASTAKAAAAMKRMAEACVDLNEFRVCLPGEMVKIIGERYPRVEERCLRLRAALNQLFIREHALTMQHLTDLGKREAREYLEGLDGVPRFATARVCLLCLGGHCAPVDGRIMRRLVDGKAIDPASTADAAASTLERAVRSGDLAEAYWLLQCAADQMPAILTEPAAQRDARKNGRASASKPARSTRGSAKEPARRKPAAD